MKNRPCLPLLLTFCCFVFGSNIAAAQSPVADAAARDDLVEVRELLRGGADVNSAHGDGMTALHWAAENGNVEMTNALLYAGSNHSAGTRIGQYTPLHIAARNGNAAVVKELLEAGADPEAITNNSGVTALHLAAANGSTDIIAALLAAGVEVDVRESARGQTPLIFASAYNRIAAINALIAAGADVSLTANVIDTFDMEKADKAADDRIEEFLAEFKTREGGGVNWQPQPSQVQAAIEASREIQRKWPNVPDPSCDDDAEGCAVAVTYNADGEPVYNHGEDDADKEEQRKSYGQRVGQWGGLTALLHAVRQGHSEATLTLLDRGADVNQMSAGDRTSPLLMASINGQFDLALLLLERGADPNLTSLAGTTPLFAVLERQWASRASYAHPTEHQQQQASHHDTMQALLDAGADPNMRLNSHLWFAEYTFSLLSGQAGLHYKGATPFWRASLALDVDAMRMLKAHGANTGTSTMKLPERRRRTPPPEPSEIESADAKVAESGEAATTPEKEEEDKDLSGLPEVPVGDDFVSPIHLAAGAGYGQWFAGNAHQYAADSWLPAIRFLVEECGADVNLRDANGYSPLHHAASRGDNDVVQYLIDQGADVMVVSRKGQTVVDMANGPIQRLSPFPQTIALLESYGAINNHNCVSC